MDTTQFNGAFWIAISASVSAFILVIVKSINKSKCSNVRFCCGLLSCQRDTKAETEIEEKTLELEEIKIVNNIKDDEDRKTQEP